MVLLIAVQLLFGRDYFWLPPWLLKRSMTSERLRKAIDWMRRPARFVDRLLRPRLTMLTEGGFIHGIALLCVVIAISMPAMEVVPFVANVAGAAFTAFGLSLIARDGLLALIALAFTLAVLGLLARTLL
jgi:hypothetical protein